MRCLAAAVLLLLAAPVSAQAPAAPQLTASLRDGVRVSVPEAAGFTAEAHLAVWSRFVAGATAGGVGEGYFDVPLVRPMIRVGAFDGIFRLLVQPELAGPAPRLLDLQLDFVPDPAFGLRVGQFITPYSRAFITPIVLLTMPDQGVVSDAFRADRDTGLMAFGSVGDAFEYSVGIFDGAAIDGRAGDVPPPMVVGRLVLTPYGHVPYDQVPALGGESPRGLAIGAGGFFRERTIADADNTPSVVQTGSAGLDLSLVEGPVAFFSEGYYREQRSDGGPWIASWGAFAQLGVFVLPRLLELSVRASWIDPDLAEAPDLVQSYEGALATYLVVDDVAYGHHLSLGLRYAYLESPRGLGAVPRGSTHRVTLQLQAWV